MAVRGGPRAGGRGVGAIGRSLTGMRMSSQLATDLAALSSRRGVLTLGGVAFSGLALSACSKGRAMEPAPADCIATPTAIRGPFPADGTRSWGRALNIL